MKANEFCNNISLNNIVVEAIGMSLYASSIEYSSQLTFFMKWVPELLNMSGKLEILCKLLVVLWVLLYVCNRHFKFFRFFLMCFRPPTLNIAITQFSIRVLSISFQGHGNLNLTILKVNPWNSLTGSQLTNSISFQICPTWTF